MPTSFGTNAILYFELDEDAPDEDEPLDELDEVPLVDEPHAAARSEREATLATSLPTLPMEFTVPPRFVGAKHLPQLNGFN